MLQLKSKACSSQKQCLLYQHLQHYKMAVETAGCSIVYLDTALGVCMVKLNFGQRQRRQTNKATSCILHVQYNVTL